MNQTNSSNPIEIIFGSILGFLTQINHFITTDFVANAFIIPLLAGFIGGFGGWVFKKLIANKIKKIIK